MKSRGEHDVFLSWIHTAPYVSTHMEMQCSKEPFSSSGKPNIWCKLRPKSLLDHLQHLSTSSHTQMAQNMWAHGPEEEAGWRQKNNIARAMLQFERGVGRISTMPIKARHAALPQNSSVLIARHQNISSSVKWVISFFLLSSWDGIWKNWYGCSHTGNSQREI